MTSLAVGIDLGTTHTALAYRELEGKDAACTDYAVPQFVSKGKLGRQTLLPSFLYFAPPNETSLGVPWDPERHFAVGEYARARGSEVPGRVVASAKSWLSCATVERREALLPLEADEGVERISPVTASQRYLEQLVETWRAEPPDGAAPLEEQDVVLTVPASFDAAARDLTVEAARTAGLTNVTLLEEPQAALYGLIDALGDEWRDALRPGDVICVVDVGGGTTDLSLIALVEVEGALEFHRVAVGDHILLGGDNMDLQLAHVARQRLAASGKTLDRVQFAGLVHACRRAKEQLLAVDAPSSAPVVVPSRGSQLIGGTLRVELQREEVEQLVVAGFFPDVSVGDHPVVRPRAGFTQRGLPYAADPAITKHLAAFLSKQLSALSEMPGLEQSASASFVHPTGILFNGGVFRAPRLRDRIERNLNAWLSAEGAPAARVLPCEDLTAAVARGASFYARSRQVGGLKIRGGTARAYYVGVESPMPAVPGFEAPVSALCVAPFGMQEGSEPLLLEQELGVVVGAPADFRFFASTQRRQDDIGTLLEHWNEGELEELAPVRVTLSAEGREIGAVVLVKLRARVTEVGTLLLEAVPTTRLNEDEAWRLELSVRSGDVP